MLRFGRLVRVCAVLLVSPFGACLAGSELVPLAPASDSEKLFLSRVMAAESGGRLNAKNPRSSALGPFQFIHTTFLDIVRRNFPAFSEAKSEAEILAFRTDPEVAWTTALIYTRENARFLSENGAAVSPANLRLAFFVGPGAALKVLTAKPEEPLKNLLSTAALEANPFLGQMTAAALIERSSREARGVGSQFAAAAAAATRQAQKPKITVLCNLKLPSCRKWLDLAEKRMGIKEARLARRTAGR